jgi:homoserine kinase
MDKAVVRSPATLSNLGSGFDVFGLALREPYDEVEVRRIPERKVVIERIEGRGSSSITVDPAKNSSGVGHGRPAEGRR